MGVVTPCGYHVVEGSYPLLYFVSIDIGQLSCHESVTGRWELREVAPHHPQTGWRGIICQHTLVCAGTEAVFRERWFVHPLYWRTSRTSAISCFFPTGCLVLRVSGLQNKTSMGWKILCSELQHAIRTSQMDSHKLINITHLMEKSLWLNPFSRGSRQSAESELSRPGVTCNRKSFWVSDLFAETASTWPFAWFFTSIIYTQFYNG